MSIIVLFGIWLVALVLSYRLSAVIVLNPKNKAGAKVLDGPIGTILTFLTSLILPLVGLAMDRWEIIGLSFFLANGMEFVIVTFAPSYQGSRDGRRGSDGAEARAEMHELMENIGTPALRIRRLVTGKPMNSQNISRSGGFLSVCGAESSTSKQAHPRPSTTLMLLLTICR
jgi:hypothetical protein